jgi:large subunit ribosomal protein L37Ae
MATKKVKSAGRFKSRYGVGIRKRVIKVESKQHQDFTCPECGFKKLKRQGTGVFNCAKCGLKAAGGAYLPVTMTGSIVRKMVAQKSFLPMASELLEASEKKVEEKPAAVAKEEKKKAKKKEKKAAKKEEKEKKEKTAEELKEQIKEVKPAEEEAEGVKENV